ncbi:MAG: hypothetical protein HOM68_03170 [Gemmatimonadetes bacterium]|jgi:hypothetical protein|nr:hypothetical protein [Gemmatimonadota bacterium]MBT4613448.1 hypothetical protein [Gemmatimonadota bacterium]MBT5055520.1 hypothetical protein [Gemmatimonadota bacterium]MBT5145765.1 hypothetical protein [Gemmatimonadota bacterium]MBT5588005.1 hypothetical protein [Gemmatimonadota bacterium]
MRLTQLVAGLHALLVVGIGQPHPTAAQDRDSSADDATVDSRIADGVGESDDDGVDWDAIKETAPEDWTEEQKAQIEAAGYDLQAITDRVRHYQREQASRPEHDGDNDHDSDGDRDGDGDHDADDDRLAQRQRRIIGAAMAAPPEQWSDELKAAIVEAGWDLDRFTEGVRQRQALADRGGLGDADRDGRVATAGDDDVDRRDVAARAMASSPAEWSDELADLGLTNTAVEESSWGQIKVQIQQK